MDFEISSFRDEKSILKFKIWVKGHFIAETKQEGPSNKDFICNNFAATMSVLDFVFPVWSNTLQEFGIAISQKKYFITLRALFSPASSLQIKSAEVRTNTNKT
jgi:hypothetical protein